MHGMILERHVAHVSLLCMGGKARLTHCREGTDLVLHEDASAAPGRSHRALPAGSHDTLLCMLV